MFKSTDIVLAYDLGGTKIAAGVVKHDGTLLKELRVPARMSEGKEAVLNQLVEMGRELIREFPEISAIGVASAGPLDPVTGELMDPHNFASEKHGRWGFVPLGKILSTALERPAAVENDAAAAILAEIWLGAARSKKNAVILTLGTGLGVGVICNGTLVRGGRELHPEGGHILLHAGDRNAPCGCGNFGCAEAYLSGRNFERRASKALGSSVPGAELAERARNGDSKAREFFSEYAVYLAESISVYVRLYYPEVVVLTGSFAKAADLFLPTTRERLAPLLAWSQGSNLIPELALSTLENRAGILGGAWVAHFRPKA